MITELLEVLEESDNVEGLRGVLKAIEHMKETDHFHVDNHDWKITLDGNDAFDRTLIHTILTTLRTQVRDKLTQLGHPPA